MEKFWVNQIIVSVSVDFLFDFHFSYPTIEASLQTIPHGNFHMNLAVTESEKAKAKLLEEIEGLNATSERCLKELQLKSDECKGLEEEKAALEINFSTVKEELSKISSEKESLKTENEELSSNLRVSFNII